MTEALWHISPKKSAILPVHLQAKDGQIHIEACYSLISTGTERLVACGGVPHHLNQQMAVPHMEGDFSFPIKYGYSLIGKIVSEHPHQGKHVHLMHPHQTHCFVNEQDITLIPEGLPPQKAILTSNVETVVNAIWDSQVTIGERVMVAGFGNIGGLLAETLRHIPGIQLSILELNNWRREKAKALGYQVLDEAPTDMDIAFDTTSSPKALQTCLDAGRTEGKVVNLSWYGNKKVELDLGSGFHYGRKQLISSQVSIIPQTMQTNWDYKKRKALVIDLLMKYPYENYISNWVPFNETPTFFEHLRDGSVGDGLIWGVVY